MNPVRVADARRTAPLRAVWLVVAAVLVLVTLGMPQAAPTSASAAEAPVSLGTLWGFGALAGTTITNTGPTTIQGNVNGDIGVYIGVYPGLAITGFPPGVLLGHMQSGNIGASWAQDDLTRAYADAAGRTTTVDLTGQDLGGKTLVPGVYSLSSSAQLTGDLTLDGQGNTDSVWVFKIGTTLTTASNSRVRFINGAQPCRVFWQVGSSATLGTGSDFSGTVMAMTSITANTGATVHGRLLARNGAVTLDSNAITTDDCAVPWTTATLHVVKHVVNDSGGTAVASDFNIHVMSGGVDVTGSPAPGAAEPGTTYTLAPGRYTISEEATDAYTTHFSLDGDEIDMEDGAAVISLLGGQEVKVLVVNNDVQMPPPPTPSLTVTKTANPPAETVVAPGQTIEYRLNYANTTDTTTTGGTLLDTLGPEVAYQPGTLVLNGTPISDSGRYDATARSITVALGSVPPNTSGVLAFKVTVGPWSESRAGLQNVSTWTADGGVSGTTAPVYHYVDSLDITKEVLNTSGSVVRTGSVLLWRIYVANRGIRPARNVVVTDIVPAGTSYVKNSMSFKNSADDSDAPTLRWSIDAIDVGETVMLTFQTKVKDNVANGTVISNTARVTSNQGPAKSATAKAPEVQDAKIVPAKTSGAEGTTLGLIGLLAVFTLGVAWSGRGRVIRSARSRCVTASVLLSAMLVLGGMEVGTAIGMPSPGEAILSIAKVVQPMTVVSTASLRSADNVSIPRLGLRVRVVEGRSTAALAKGAWHQPPSVRPGQKGASVIAGHRISSQFRRLNKVRIGDTVRVTVRGRVRTYRVASVTTKSAGKGLYFRTGVREKLVLYTCVPRWQGDKRTVVVCLPVTK